MRKVFRTLFVVALAVGISTSAAMAGTFTLNGGQPFSIAREITENALILPLPVGDVIQFYKPALPAPGSVTGPSFTLTLTGANLSTASPALAICRDDTDVAVATYISKVGNTVNFQPVAGEILANGINYYIADNTCTTNPFLLQISNWPTGGTSVSLSLTAGAGGVTDTAQTVLAEAKTQFSAYVWNNLDAQIDPQAAFKAFVGPSTDDSVAVQLQSETLNRMVPLNPLDKITFAFDITDIAGLSSGGLSAITPWGNAMNCAINTTTKKATCTRTGLLEVGSYWFTFEVNGEKISDKKFVVTTEIDFGAPNVKDRLVSNNWPVLLNEVAGQWVRYGYTAIVPYITTLSAFNTICLVNNTSENSTQVYFEVLSTQGGKTSDSMMIGEIAANTTRRFDINTSVTPYVGNNPSVPGTPIPVTGVLADDKYSAMIYVPTVPNQVSVSCVQIENNGPKRLVPVLTRYPFEFWQQ